MIGDNRMFMKNEPDNMNMVSRICSFAETNNFNNHSQS